VYVDRIERYKEEKRNDVGKRVLKASCIPSFLSTQFTSSSPEELRYPTS
jgi:hypothetical protein